MQTGFNSNLRHCIAISSMHVCQKQWKLLQKTKTFEPVYMTQIWCFSRNFLCNRIVLHNEWWHFVSPVVKWYVNSRVAKTCQPSWLLLKLKPFLWIMSSLYCKKFLHKKNTEKFISRWKRVLLFRCAQNDGFWSKIKPYSSVITTTRDRASTGNFVVFFSRKRNLKLETDHNRQRN